MANATSLRTSELDLETPAYRYRAYGLSVASELLLPELVPLVVEAETAHADILIRRRRLRTQPAATNRVPDYVRPIANGVEFYSEKIGTIQVCGGREIVVDPAPGAADSVLRPILLGAAFNMLLLLRGQVALHASVVSIAGRAVAFLGEKGAGKSTLAAALQSRGHALVADDTLAFDLAPGTLVAHPGFAHMKLWPDTVVALGQNPAHYPSQHPQFPKRIVRLRSGNGTAAVPLHSLCLLRVGPELMMERLTPRAALFDLLPHWSGARLSRAVLEHLGLATQFKHCLAVAGRVPVYQLQRPFDFSRLGEVTELVTRFMTNPSCPH